MDRCRRIGLDLAVQGQRLVVVDQLVSRQFFDEPGTIWEPRHAFQTYLKATSSCKSELTSYFQAVKSVRGGHFVAGFAFQHLLVHALLDSQVEVFLVGPVAVLLRVDEPPEKESALKMDHRPRNTVLRAILSPFRDQLWPILINPDQS